MLRQELDTRKDLNIMPRKTITFLLLFVLSVAWIAHAEEVPSILWSQHDSAKAAWVTPDRAIVNGHIDWSLFGGLQAAVLQGAIERSKGAECISEGTLRKEIVGAGVANSLAELAQNSVAAFSGTLINRVAGFADGDPATLLQVRVDKVLKSSPQFSIRNSGDLLYVAYPVAEFQAGNLKFCKSDDTLLREIPKVGDKILVFPMSGPLNEDLNMAYVYSQELFVQSASGDLGIPPRWRKDSKIDKVTTLGEIESMLKVDLTGSASGRKEGQ
jgi:hypothetical protein